jgi:hypothetical protein
MSRKLSKRAIKMLHRLYEGQWYPAFIKGDIPKAMQELIDAGLVTTAGRIQRIVRCYVPKGTKPTNFIDRIPSKPKWLQNSN